MRKQTIVGYMDEGWTLQTDGSHIAVPLMRVHGKEGLEKIKLTLENCETGEEGVIIENEM